MVQRIRRWNWRVVRRDLFSESSVKYTYINYLALDRDKPKQRLLKSQADELQTALARAKQDAQLFGERVQREQEENSFLKAELAETKREISELRRRVELLLGSVREVAVVG